MQVNQLKNKQSEEAEKVKSEYEAKLLEQQKAHHREVQELRDNQSVIVQAKIDAM